MDDKPQTAVDEEDETADSSADSGPLGRLVEQKLGSSTVESEEATQLLNKPSQPRYPQTTSRGRANMTTIARDN